METQTSSQLAERLDQEPEPEADNPEQALAAKLREAAGGFGGLNAMDITPEIKRNIVKSFMTAAAWLLSSGARLVLPAYHHELQAAWPAECPFSEPELRAKATALVETVREMADRRREVLTQAREILGLLPAVADPWNRRPKSVYNVLYDTVSWIVDCQEEDELIRCLGYLEEQVAATPESLRTEWLQGVLGYSLGRLEEPEIDEVITALAGIVRIERGRPNEQEVRYPGSATAAASSAREKD